MVTRAAARLMQHREGGRLTAARSPTSLDASSCTPDPASLWTCARVLGQRLVIGEGLVAGQDVAAATQLPSPRLTSPKQSLTCRAERGRCTVHMTALRPRGHLVFETRDPAYRVW